MTVPLVAGSPEARIALALPREDWADHPNFRAQALLLGSHQSFREVSDQLVRWASNGVDSSTIRRVFGAWKSAMHRHEAYEEHKLYPYLERRWRLSFDGCEKGHRAIGNAEATVFAMSIDPGPSSTSLVSALVDHDRILVEHLAEEEELVLPGLLALTAEEFADYSAGR